MKNELGKGQVLACRECKSECELSVPNNLGESVLMLAAKLIVVRWCPVDGLLSRWAWWCVVLKDAFTQLEVTAHNDAQLREMKVRDQPLPSSSSTFAASSASGSAGSAGSAAAAAAAMARPQPLLRTPSLPSGSRGPSSLLPQLSSAAGVSASSGSGQPQAQARSGSQSIAASVQRGGRLA